MLKENFNKIKTALADKNKASAVGQVIGIVVILFLLLLISGAALIFGLNLMGLDIPYTIKTCLGACLVILMIRPSPSSKE